jgi:hypothetical protein
MNQPVKAMIGGGMLAATGKAGKITKHEDGYYRVPLGVYGTRNNVGMLYDERTGLQMFAEGGPLMRQVQKGDLYGEWKHPEREPGWNEDDYVRRIRKVDADRHAIYIAGFDLVPIVDDEGRKATMVVGHIKPWGPYGHYVEEALNDPRQNCCFSVRSITVDDLMRGIKYTKEVITYDWVPEGGILQACKYHAPSLEEYGVELSRRVLLKLQYEQEQNRNLGLEDYDCDFSNVLRELTEANKKDNRPAFMRW